MSKAFQQAVRSALRTLGALEIVSVDTLAYEVDTSVGILRVVPGNGSIQCCFEEPIRARKKVLCNARTGKWNHFQLQNETMKEFVDDFERSLMYLKGGLAS